MNQNQNKNIWYAVIVVSLIIILATRKKRKDMEILVKGEYIVPSNVANRADALHSFERRKSDGFGGRMTTKIREAMLSLYKQGINPDVQDIKIVVDSTKYKVTWEAKVVPSKDGKAYVGLSTVGSAGAGADSRAKNQIPALKKWVPGAEDYTLALDFVNPKGVYIRQYFYKYTKPKDFPFFK